METLGGALLLDAAAALIWANSPWSDAYESLRDAHVGPAGLHLNLSLQTWSADGLLAIFFFVAAWNSSASSSPATFATRAWPRCRSPRRSAASPYRPACTSPSTSAAAETLVMRYSLALVLMTGHGRTQAG